MFASSGAAAPNYKPSDSVKKIISWQKPYIDEACQPDPVFKKNCRLTRHKLVSVEDVVSAYHNNTVASEHDKQLASKSIDSTRKIKSLV
jgi:hypothetical protein